MHQDWFQFDQVIGKRLSLLAEDHGIPTLQSSNFRQKHVRIDLRLFVLAFSFGIWFSSSYHLESCNVVKWFRLKHKKYIWHIFLEILTKLCMIYIGEAFHDLFLVQECHLVQDDVIKWIFLWHSVMMPCSLLSKKYFNFSLTGLGLIGWLKNWIGGFHRFSIVK